MHSRFDFAGAEVVVVGASRAGIGAAIARAFQDAGARVAITGAEPEAAPEDMARFDYTRLDVTDGAAVRDFAAGRARLDVLVNCAAITARGEEMAPDFFAHVVNVNLHGTFRMAEAFHGALKAAGGCLVNIASMYAMFGSPRNPAYGASKAAVVQLTKSLAIAWAGDGIRVNAVAPGFIVTQQSARSRTDPAHVAAVNLRTPMGRWGEPEDIAGPVLFLASDAAGFMTGTCLAIDGGIPLPDPFTIGAAVIGTGFIGTVHLGALRRLGVPVAGVLGSSPARGAERARALGVPRAYGSLDDLLADPAVQVVHVTSPNVAHFDQVRRILAAGRHVICEKPLAMTSEQSAEMVALAAASGRIAAVCYNTRFYPLNQQARGMVAAGELGKVRLVSGRYHQDWLAHDTDWNWRLEANEGGALRSVGDIGTHWVDLVGFITGLRVASVMADLVTVHPERRRPTGPVETFSAAKGATETREVTTDDVATILLRFAGGARGVMSTSQISQGRKNAMGWEIAGSKASAAWEAEVPDHLWIGHRDAPNQVLQRDPGLMNATGAAAAALPGGHVEGFADTFHALFRQVYADVAHGGRGPGSTWATFEDGHHEMQFCDAVLASSTEGRWVELGQG